MFGTTVTNAFFSKVKYQNFFKIEFPNWQRETATCSS